MGTVAALCEGGRMDVCVVDEWVGLWYKFLPYRNLLLEAGLLHRNGSLRRK